MQHTPIGKFCTLASLIITGLCATVYAQKAKLGPKTVETQEAKTDYIRVFDKEKNVFLQTGITTFTKEDVTVDLIGAIHIADKPYYKQLNKEFTHYEVLLYEMIGGEWIKEHLNAQDKPLAATKDTQMSFLSGMYETMTKKLDLSGQKDVIDYSPKNFVHADLTLQEFNNLQKKKGESLLKFAFQNALEQAKQQAKAKGPKPPSSLKLLKAMLLGTPNDLKLLIVDTLGSGDDQVGAIAGKNSVIIGDRNLKCLKVMNEQIAAGKKKIGVFYGAAHFPDMEERMIKMGFTQTAHRWLNAWKLDKKVKAKKIQKIEKDAA